MAQLEQYACEKSQCNLYYTCVSQYFERGQLILKYLSFQQPLFWLKIISTIRHLTYSMKGYIRERTHEPIKMLGVNLTFLNYAEMFNLNCIYSFILKTLLILLTTSQFCSYILQLFCMYIPISLIKF